MGTRARWWIALAFTVPVGLVIGRLSRAGDWGLLEIYGAMAVAFVFLGIPALFWIDCAPDGPMRRRRDR